MYICGSKNGSSSSTVNTGKFWCDVHVLLGIWNQNSNTVIYEKCCSYLSFSIYSKDQLFMTLSTFDLTILSNQNGSYSICISIRTHSMLHHTYIQLHNTWVNNIKNKPLSNDHICDNLTLTVDISGDVQLRSG